MGLLDSLLGDSQQKQACQDYVSRYQEGAPHEGYSDQEVLQRYQQVAPQLPPQDHQQAAEQAFSRMSPQERTQSRQYVQQQAQMQNTPADTYADPRHLAQQTTQHHQQQPAMVSQLLAGGAGSGILGSPVATAALAGIAAMAVANAMHAMQCNACAHAQVPGQRHESEAPTPQNGECGPRRLPLESTGASWERGWLIRLPVRAEYVEVDKRVVVYERVSVRRHQTDDVAHVNANVLREELRVDRAGGEGATIVSVVRVPPCPRR